MNPARLLISDLIGHPGARRGETFSLEVLAEMDVARITEPVDVDVTIEAGTRDVLAKGTAAYRATLICNRCLTEFPHEGAVSLSQPYSEQPASDDILPIDHGHIDLAEPVHDEVVLDLPLTPLCRPECAGLCPTCGTDLNTDPCEGHDDTGSSPFAILQDLLDPEDR
ncbi:MAG: YceD family protein [Acidimicrobiia bacterium]|nr:YceD family protein [Acidimicrobiia bacterium]